MIERIKFLAFIFLPATKLIRIGLIVYLTDNKN